MNVAPKEHQRLLLLLILSVTIMFLFRIIRNQMAIFPTREVKDLRQIRMHRDIGLLISVGQTLIIRTNLISSTIHTFADISVFLDRLSMQPFLREDGASAAAPATAVAVASEKRGG
jgi:hypothetical protein